MIDRALTVTFDLLTSLAISSSWSEEELNISRLLEASHGRDHLSLQNDELDKSAGHIRHIGVSASGSFLSKHVYVRSYC